MDKETFAIQINKALKENDSKELLLLWSEIKLQSWFNSLKVNLHLTIAENLESIFFQINNEIKNQLFKTPKW